ncbi:MAG: TIGR00159 family protein [Candidatus Melainabacteria bacterium GWF2_37_15]|nr:MAG: TIGR00159 family protein [Candidatus Melainabacteria bacterium GWF2_37_15]
MFDQLPQVFQSFLDIISSLWEVNLPWSLVNLFQILILAFFVFRVYRYIAGTHAEQLLKGILVLIFALLLSKMFNLQIISTVLESVVNIVIFSLVVIFQPELRRALGYLGQKGFLNKHIGNNEGEFAVQEIIENVVNAIKHLSKSHTGALIVFQNTKGIENTTEVGTKLHALISTELLLTIFHPNTPLHDGAVVIKGNRIIASGVLLPLTEDPKLSWQYGTRHRAAIGMSEISDATCLVVSEETGNISIAQGGKLINISDLAELKDELEFLYGISESVKEKTEEEVKEKSKFRFYNFFTTDLLLKKDENK